MTRVSLPSFSLIELLVVMVLSSIIIGMIYFSYATISSYQLRLTAQKRAAEEAATLYFILKKDMEQSASVRATAAETILCERFPVGVSYDFYEGYVLRHQSGRVDTFRLRFERPGFYQKGRRIEKHPTIIDQIRLTPLASEQPSIGVTVHKYYDAAALIELTEDDSIQ